MIKSSQYNFAISFLLNKSFPIEGAPISKANQGASCGITLLVVEVYFQFELGLLLQGVGNLCFVIWFCPGPEEELAGTALPLPRVSLCT